MSTAGLSRHIEFFFTLMLCHSRDATTHLPKSIKSARAHKGKHYLPSIWAVGSVKFSASKYILPLFPRRYFTSRVRH